MSSTATSSFNTFFGMAYIVIPADLRSLFKDEYPKFTDYEGQSCVEICHSYYPIINDEVYSRTLYSIYHLHNPEATRCFFDTSAHYQFLLYATQAEPASSPSSTPYSSLSCPIAPHAHPS